MQNDYFIIDVCARHGGRSEHKHALSSGGEARLFSQHWYSLAFLSVSLPARRLVFLYSDSPSCRLTRAYFAILLECEGYSILRESIDV